MTTRRELAALLTPPLLVKAWPRIVRAFSPRRSASTLPHPSAKPEWECIPEGWAYADTHPEVRGWNVQEVLETYMRKWPRFAQMVSGTGPLGVAHESDLTTSEDVYHHNTMMSVAYSLALAARHKDRLSMLDWGGGIGHYYLLAQALLPHMEIEYHCKDMPALSQHGAQLFPTQHFYIDDACLGRTYDFVMANTSLHYSRDWRAVLSRLAGAASDLLYVGGVPTVWHSPSSVFVQRPYQYGYNTEYLGWCLNRTEFLRAAAEAGLTLVREFALGYQPYIHGAAEQNVYRGYLLRVVRRAGA